VLKRLREIRERLREDVACVFERDPAARTWWEVVTTYPGVQAVWLHRISHWLWNHRWFWLARLLSYFARWYTGIEIHPAAEIGRRFFIDHGMGVVIGETAVVGDDCTIYHGVTLGGTSWQKGKRHPTLGNGVVVGAGAKILGPIKVGDNARIGSNSVVLKDVPPAATVVGIPGHVVHKASAAQKAAIAKQLHFDAYGLSPDMPDPIAYAINRILEHLQALDRQVEELRTALRATGITLPEIELPPLEACELRDGEEKKDA
jgi:serine O-acetyltransferase